MKKTIVCVVLCLLMLVSNVAAVSADGNYADNGVCLEVGTYEYETDTAYDYTLFYVAPSEVGKYIITCEEQLIGMASYNDMWVMFPPTADTVNTNLIEWSCSSVGQGIIIAVGSGDGLVSITLAQEDLVQKEEVPWTIYENRVTPEKFTFSGDAAALLAVNTADTTVDSAVLGADGYYHLNAANGPILYAKVKDTKMSLANVSSYGQLKEVVKDEDGNTISKTDFNTAVDAYVSCADSKTSLYPLTIDLIEVFRRVGAYQGWYGSTGFVGGELDDAWMFACYYNEPSEEPTPAGDVNLDGTVDLNDATALFYHVNGLSELGEDALTVADLNADGMVGLTDATALFYQINGLA